jgi:chemotaxis protein MotB
MKVYACLPPLLIGGIVLISTGCCVPKTQFCEIQAQNRALSEQNRAQLAEIENLKVHNDFAEDKLSRAEEDLARLEERIDLSRIQLASYQQEHAVLGVQVQDLIGRSPAARLPQSVSNQLKELSKRYPNLHFDPVTGIAKIETDILFDGGQVELKSGARELAGDLARVLKSPEAGNLKVMVVGHTDDRQVAKNPPATSIPTIFTSALLGRWQWPICCSRPDFRSSVWAWQV